MNRFKKLGVWGIISALVLSSCTHSQEPAYLNPSLDTEERVEDLLGRMTLEEKFWQLFMIPGDLDEGKEKYKHGIFGFQIDTKGSSESGAEQLLDYAGGKSAKETAEKINAIQKYFLEETRLGIPIIPFDEALHGLVREGATGFPQAIGLAASFDTTNVANVARAIAAETKSRGIRQILSPVLNIARDVRWGRTEETYGEDTYLTTQMAMSFISQFEKIGVVTTPKHFVANVGDGGRDSYPIHYNERLLEEVYFPAYKAVFQKAGARSVMTSYNSLDGTACTGNDWLLNKKLKDEWGFDGFVISDAGATGGANVLHFTSESYAESTEESIEGGLDVIFQTAYDHYPLFYEAFEKGMVDEAAMNEAVRRVLRAKFQLGLFENPYVDPQLAASTNGSSDNRHVALEAARKSIVLLKNSKETLPLSKDIKSIALIGVDAEEARPGGYAGPGNKPISIKSGIEALIGDAKKVNYLPGPGRDDIHYVSIPAVYLSHKAGQEVHSGLEAKYWNNINFEGPAVLKRVDKDINFRWTLFSPDPSKINYDFYSARWKGSLKAPESGTFEIGLKGNEGFRMYINGKLHIDRWDKLRFATHTRPYKFEKGKSYDIKVEFHESIGNAWFSMVWNQGVENNADSEIAKAVRAARKSEHAVVVVGIEEGEFQDRALLSLPGRQEELIQAVAATGTPTTVLLVGGSAITMSNWIDDVQSIVDVWYPGDAGGQAVAEVLFGDYNPAGRLPVTFPVHEGQVPLYYNHKPTGRGDDYINLSGKPLFAFGYGLSYTKFDYQDLNIEKTKISAQESTTVSFTLRNSGAYDGDEVVQLYIRDELASVVRPVMELKGFQRVHLKKGESKRIEFDITSEMLSMLDINLKTVVEPGRFRIMIGANSNDIKLRKHIEVI